MATPHESQTRMTLLSRLARSGQADQAAWAEFVDHYGRKVYQWCARWGLQEADAEDVTQTVLLKLAARMKDFAYDPSKSFRAWLKTVAHHAWRDFVDARRRTAVEGVPAAEVARRLDMKVARVYAARSHIQQRLQEECRRLEEGQ